MKTFVVTYFTSLKVIRTVHIRCSVNLKKNAILDVVKYFEKDEDIISITQVYENKELIIAE